jgi:hypothetical protein
MTYFHCLRVPSIASMSFERSVGGLSRCNSGGLKPKAGIHSSPDFDGPIGEANYPETPWWNVWKKLEEYSPKERIVGLLAILGAFLGLRDYLAVFLAPPEVAISYPDAAHVDAVAGAQFVVPLAVRSEVRFAPAYVSFVQHEVRLSGGALKSVSLSRDTLPNLAAGVSEPINISGMAPEFSRKQWSPDVYHFSIGAQASAGFVRGRRLLDAPICKGSPCSRRSVCYGLGWQNAGAILANSSLRPRRVAGCTPTPDCGLRRGWRI